MKIVPESDCALNSSAKASCAKFTDYTGETPLRVDEVLFGDVSLGYWVLLRPKAKTGWRYNRTLHQLRDLEDIIRHRHGATVPETDDATIYGDVAAILHLITDRDGIEKSFPAWCSRWMPWASRDLVDQMLYDHLRQHYRAPCDDSLARMIRLSYAERQELGITTFGSHDVAKKDRAKLQAQHRRERDKARKTTIRRKRGSMTRAAYEANSASRRKPWDQLGMSRSKYYRHRRADR